MSQSVSHNLFPLAGFCKSSYFILDAPMTALIVRVMAGETADGSFVRQLLDGLTFGKEINLVSRERAFHLALLARSIPTAGWRV